MLRAAAEDAARDLQILSDLAAPAVKRAQATGAILAIQSTLSSFWSSLGDVVRAGKSDAASEAVLQGFAVDLPKWRKIRPSTAERNKLRDALEASARFNVESALARVYKSYIPLSTQVYKTEALANDWVDKRVNSGLARGLTVNEMQKEVKEFIRPEVKGGVAYAARRLARSEINNAYHAATIVDNEDKPWVAGMVWRLSGSHPRLDICDLLAKDSPYPKSAVPPKAHPHCLCTTFPESVSDADFWDAFNDGDYDGYIDALPG
jgi:hypothetical protein